MLEPSPTDWAKRDSTPRQNIKEHTGLETMGIFDTIMMWVMAARADASLPNMRLGGKPVEEGQNALMVWTLLF